jgi:hypothetical protein
VKKADPSVDVANNFISIKPLDCEEKRAEAAAVALLCYRLSNSYSD